MKIGFSSDDFQTKLMLLYMLEQIEIPLTEQFIIDICTTRNAWINYMECISVFHDLMRDGFIYSPDQTTSKRQRYTLSAKGRNALDIYYEEIPEDLRKVISDFSKSNRIYIKRLQEYIATCSQNPDGTFLVTLQIIDTTSLEPMFEIKINMQTKTEANNAIKIWTTKAPSFYEFVYANLLN